jgi:hypothetical protein
LSKAFEILVEYAWKELKFRVEDSGLFAPSPKEAVRQAATMGLISDPEKWIAIINARNDSVHDYFTVPEKDYVSLASELLRLIQPLHQGEPGPENLHREIRKMGDI